MWSFDNEFQLPHHSTNQYFQINEFLNFQIKKIMYTELTEDALQQIVADNEKVVVQYGATWCGNCRIMKPKFKKLAAENDAIPFLYVDAEKLPESRKLAKVDNLPTFAIFKNGELVNQVQSNQAESLTNLFNELN